MCKNKIVSMITILVFVSLLVSCKSKLTKPGPDVVLITIDTLRSDYLGCYGNPVVRTPYIDMVSKKGSLFMDTVSSVPITLPSHCTIMTGLYPPVHNVRNNGIYKLGKKFDTMAEILKQEGYKTYATVGAMVLNSTFGLAQGFDYYDDYVFLVNDSRNSLATYYPERKAATVNKRVFSILDEKVNPEKDSSFFWIHYFDPHSPYNPPFPYETTYRDNRYMGEVTYTDQAIGDVLIKVERSGQDTFWIITSDHGEGLGEHGESTHSTFIYDSTLVVPLIFSWKNHVPGSRVYAGQVQLTDILPTMLDMLGLEKPSKTNGVSLKPWFDGQQVSPRKCYVESFQPWLEFGWSPLRGFRTGKYKYIEAPRKELYSLETDPSEKINLVANKLKLVDEFEKELTSKYGTDVRIKVSAEDLSSSAVIENLKSLGYLMGDSYNKNVGNKTELMDPKDKIKLLNMYILAGEMLRNNNLEQARKLYETMIQEDPTNSYTQAALGTLYANLSQYDKAIRHFKKSLEILPENPVATINMGLCWKLKGETGKAVEHFESILSNNPLNENAYLNLVTIFLEQEKKTAVMDVFKRWEKHMPNNPKLYFEKARSYLHFNDTQNAFEACNKAIKMFPEYSAAYRLRGQVYILLKRLDDAEKDLFKAYNLDPENLNSARQLINFLVATKRYDEAMNLFKNTLQYHPSNLDLLIDYGIALAQVGKPGEAIKLFQRTRKKYPDNTWILYNLGYINLHKGNVNDASNYFKQAIEKDPANLKAHGMLGIIHLQSNELDKAIKEFRYVLKLDPDNKTAKHYLEKIKEKKKK